MKKKISALLCGVSLAMSALLPMGADAAAQDRSVSETPAAIPHSVEPMEYTGEYAGDETPENGAINETQFKNRMILRQAMMKHGFRPIATEWWHFILDDEPYPETYFNFPVRRIP